MPLYHVVVADEAKAHEAHKHSYRHHPHLVKHLAVRPVGTVHAASVESECPNGLPNCRNCGDPAHAASCQASGHCPDCGTLHGIAPDAVIEANGYRLEIVS